MRSFKNALVSGKSKKDNDDSRSNPSASNNSSSLPTSTISITEGTSTENPTVHANQNMFSPLTNIGGNEDTSSVLTDFTVRTNRSHYTIPNNMLDEDVIFSLQSPFAEHNIEIEASPMLFLNLHGKLSSMSDMNLIGFLSEDFVTALSSKLGVIQRAAITNAITEGHFSLFARKRNTLVNVHQPTSFLKYIKKMIEQGKRPHILVDLPTEVFDVTREKIELERKLAAQPSPSEQVSSQQFTPPPLETVTDTSHIQVASTNGVLHMGSKDTSSGNIQVHKQKSHPVHQGPSHFQPPSTFQRPTRSSTLLQHSRGSTQTGSSLPMIPKPYDPKLRSLGRSEFDSRKFSQFMMNHILKDDSERGIRNLYNAFGQGIEYGLKGSDQILPDLDYDLTRVTGINELLLDTRDQNHPYYNQAVDNINVIQRQVHNILTNNVNVPKTMEKTWLIIERFANTILDGFELLMLVLREFFPHLGGPPLEVSKEIVQMVVEQGDTLQTYYARTLSLATRLKTSQQQLPINDLFTVFLENLMRTRKLETRLQQVHSDLVAHKLRNPNIVFPKSIHQLYRELEQGGIDTDLSLTPDVTCSANLSTISESEAYVTTIDTTSVMDKLGSLPNEIMAMMAAGLKKEQVIDAKPFRLSKRCPACFGRHPINKCFLMGFVPHQLQAQVDRYKTAHPEIKPDPDHMKKTFAPPAARKKIANSAEIDNSAEFGLIANYTDMCLPAAFASEVCTTITSTDASPTADTYDSPVPEDAIAMNAEVEKYLIDFNENTNQFDYVQQM